MLDEERGPEPDVIRCLRALVAGGEAGVVRPNREQVLGVLLGACSELTRARRELDTTKAELVEMREAYKAFAYSVSHDLRAPLRAIAGFSGILQEMPAGQVDDEARRLLAMVSENATTMSAQLDGLLVLSRLEHYHLRPSVIDMTGLARSVVDEVRRQQPERQVAVRVHPLAPAVADLAAMRQALTELVANAWKFTRKRSPASIEIASEARETEDVYLVRDDGVGFVSSLADRLFTMFRRLHRPAEFEGLGVGLAVVRTIVARHRGRVWAEGALDAGATFYFALPRRPLTSAEVVSDPDSAGARSTTRDKGSRDKEDCRWPSAFY